ncbi:MAG: alpha/beta hydrolase [Oleibacter sp.]|nr:alpha/beta hydrolase [Thalassolituus sp.]
MHTSPVIVLLRGLIRSRFHWGEFPQRFSEEFTVIETELPGNGYRFSEQTPSSIQDMMTVLRDDVRKQHTGPVILIAISMGGMIASEWAKQYPNEVLQLHLINTSLANLSLPWQRMNALAFFRFLGALGSVDRLEKGILDLTINHGVQEDMSEHWLTFAKSHPLQWRNIFTQLAAASRYRGPVQAPIQNAWLYNSTCDRLVRPECSEIIAKRWQKPLTSHPTAGHDLPIDDPDWLENAIREKITLAR